MEQVQYKFSKKCREKHVNKTFYVYKYNTILFYFPQWFTRIQIRQTTCSGYCHRVKHVDCPEQNQNMTIKWVMVEK